MAIIIEVRRRGGQLIERTRCEGSSFRVGRAYDNDVIIDDPFVSPHHIRLDACEDGWKVTDLDSLNGYRIKSQGRTVHRDLIKSGEKMRIGHVTLRVFHSHHAVAPALKVNGLERGLKVLGWHKVWPFVVAAVVASTLLRAYLRTVNEMELMPALNIALDQMIVVGGLGLVWAVAGRIFRHQPRFFSHLSMWSIYTLLTQLSDALADLIGYNLGSDIAHFAVDTLMHVLLLALVVWSSLSLATNLRSRSRYWSAVGTSLVFLSLQFFEVWRIEQLFSGAPDYQGGVKPPLVTWAPGQSSAALGEALERSFDSAQALAEEEI